MEHLFKVGDKVLVSQCGFTDQIGGSNSSMVARVGTYVTIASVPHHNYYRIKEDAGFFIWDKRCFEAVDSVSTTSDKYFKVNRKVREMIKSRKEQGYAF